jgi:hypothetical protein
MSPIRSILVHVDASARSVVRLRLAETLAVRVMGCYGHSRARELVLGGVSRTIMDSMTIPVLMAH